MKWKGRRQSSNVEDRRGQSSGGSGLGGLTPMFLISLVRFLFTKTGLIIAGVLLVGSMLLGYNPLNFIGQLFTGSPVTSETSAPYQGTQKEEELADFSATILASTEDVWNQLISNYEEPTLVLFTGSVSSACGYASSATGPFYCPGDDKLYLDLSFFDDMERKLNAPGDFAQAYVIAHEVGHHVQNLLGISDKVQRLRGQMSQTEFNKYSVRLELQADFLAGVWAHHSQQMTQMMETGDLQEALNAAYAIGDDRLQKQSSGRVVPDSFTHGTSEQRIRWFKKGFETGDINQGDTFNANPL
ncbi:KPN_02809 family neutral zinc metallopeptidase [Mangrovimonas futianensis]|uniref:KPN_02809 family neutral zinc metallopeptidase n=1 Tax=Mangrovimonas futianensis TaxID=2895523 RepID=UPI001E377C67|nr:neutral zinc metallopeptidase [Mangrovimonas futianensis]MCF1422655.1 zinc metallopeptidase [Mangrovimonas futianensis]